MEQMTHTYPGDESPRFKTKCIMLKLTANGFVFLSNPIHGFADCDNGSDRSEGPLIKQRYAFPGTR